MKTAVLIGVLCSLYVLPASSSPVLPQAVDDEYVTVFIPPHRNIFDSNEIIDFEWDSEPMTQRSGRETETCELPKPENDSYFHCKIYPARVTCTQTCIFGSTLEEGIQREMYCKKDENRWTPEIEVCKPFIDCTLSMGPGGKYICYNNYLRKGPECTVSCDAYEDKPAVGQKTYTCDIEGVWKPKLPDCAKAGTGIVLVPPPKGPKHIDS